MRLRGPDWEEGQQLHPEERFISMVEEKATAPRSVGQYFDSARSPRNPYNCGEGPFALCTFPVILTKAVARAVGMPGYGGA